MEKMVAYKGQIDSVIKALRERSSVEAFSNQGEFETRKSLEHVAADLLQKHSVQKVKPIDWNANGFGHTPVGLTFRVVPTYGGFILERHEGSCTTKSFHDLECTARQFAFEKYCEQLMSCFE